ncbi:hypothetical protein RRG08_026921 [Elysia crispata]|uniref:Uncharacterized protein n=1 Tax=Elysia crispata TaxID=231223 RepID=A0AAE0Z584_9GAST|nr:hypothetical protein RRG08_026921 [Elysia crispata]
MFHHFIPEAWETFKVGLIKPTRKLAPVSPVAIFPCIRNLNLKKKSLPYPPHRARPSPLPPRSSRYAQLSLGWGPFPSTLMHIDPATRRLSKGQDGVTSSSKMSAARSDTMRISGIVYSPEGSGKWFTGICANNFS